MGEQYGSRQKETANHSQSSSCHHRPTPNPFMDSVKRLRPLADPTPRDSVQSHICCPELFQMRRATPGSSGHVGYSEGNGPPQARQRYLKASSSERKMETQLQKWEWNAQKQKFYIEEKKKKREKKSKDDRRDRDREREREQRENGALTESKQTAQRKRYYPPLHWFDGIG